MLPVTVCYIIYIEYIYTNLRRCIIESQFLIFDNIPLLKEHWQYMPPDTRNTMINVIYMISNCNKCDWASNC